MESINKIYSKYKLICKNENIGTLKRVALKMIAEPKASEEKGSTHVFCNGNSFADKPVLIWVYIVNEFLLSAFLITFSYIFSPGTSRDQF